MASASAPAAWPSRRLLDLLRVAVPIVQAPMAGAMDVALAIAAARGGALGSLPCAMLSADQVRAHVAAFRAGVTAPVNLNFFCHVQGAADVDREIAWRRRLAPYYEALGLDPAATTPAASRRPFDAAAAAVVEEVRPQVASFHFGLPDAALFARVKAAGAVVLASATTVREAQWLEVHGADVIIAQGAEAGGHRSMLLTDDAAAQPGTLALVPQVDDAVRVPVIAAGGIADGRGVLAAIALGASGVQIGTAYLGMPRGEDRGAVSRRARDRGRHVHGPHERDERAAGARDRQPDDARARPTFAVRPRVPARRRGARAAARGGRGARIGRLHAAVGGPGPPPSRTARRPRSSRARSPSTRSSAWPGLPRAQRESLPAAPHRLVARKRASAWAFGTRLPTSIRSSRVWKPDPRGPRPSIDAIPRALVVLASLPPPMSGASSAPRP